MNNSLRLIWTNIKYVLLRPLCGPSGKNADMDIYASRMLTTFNKFHDFIFPRFYSKMRVDQDSLNAVKEKLDGSIPIYVSTDIGQLEYNYFNYLFLKELLPLAEYTNGLSVWQWMPLSLVRKTLITRLSRKKELGGRIPHPISSGYVESLIKNGKSVLVRLRTTNIHDDLFWDLPQEDILTALIRAQREIKRPIDLIPQQFLWARRPTPGKRSIIDWLFGERENPGRLRKIILFWRNYKKHALVQFSEPLNLKDFLEAHPGLSDEELARILRNTLLSQIKQKRKKITGPALKPRRWIIENVVESENVQREIYTISNERNKDPDDLKVLAARYAKEIAADVGYSYVEFGIRTLNWVFNSMYDGIHFNADGLQKVKDTLEHSPVIFVPNHRSHVDYLLLSTLLYGNDIAVPHVAAGVNLSFWPLGPFFRKCGAFFLRRTFAGNTLYKAVFESYLRLLIQEGYCQEFFIEGGRSRTGKLSQPKMGMLSMLTQAMMEKASKDLYFVPTSITYDKVVEESIYVDESSGKPKKRESFFDIFKLTKYAKHRYGKIYVNFSTPISFNEAAKGFILEKVGDEGKTKIVEKLAFEITSSINEAFVVTPSALVATAFLMEGKRGITSKRLFQNIDLIRTYLEYTNIQLSDSLVSEPKRSVNDSLQQLTANKLIDLHQDFDPVYYSISEDKRSSLDFQKNTISHFLLPVAYTALALVSVLKEGRTTFAVNKIDPIIDFLKGLFKFEFTAHASIVSKSAIHEVLDFFVRRDIIEMNEDKSSVTVKTLGTEILKRYRSIIANSLDSYQVAFYTCSTIPQKNTVSEKNLVKLMLQNGKHLLLLGKIDHPEAISAPAFKNGIKFFKALGCLIEEDGGKESKDGPKYRLNRSDTKLEELQQELELLS